MGQTKHAAKIPTTLLIKYGVLGCGNERLISSVSVNGPFLKEFKIKEEVNAVLKRYNINAHNVVPG